MLVELVILPPVMPVLRLFVIALAVLEVIVLLAGDCHGGKLGRLRLGSRGSRSVPVALGLGDFGRPGSYVARQISRWGKQYKASETEKIEPMDRLLDWLPAHLPANNETVLVHAWVEGTPVLDAPPARRDDIAAALVRFHVGSARSGTVFCDPSPGNALALDDGRVAFVDFGATRQVEVAAGNGRLEIETAMRDDVTQLRVPREAIQFLNAQ